MLSFRTIVYASCALALGVAVYSQDKTCTEALGFKDTPMLPGEKWHVHDLDRPHPPIVTPGRQPGDPPSDAVVLFNGKDLSNWENSKDGKLGPAAWKVGDGYFEVVPGTGDLITKEKFGTGQYHVEWASPAKVESCSQARGNSGFLIMHRYEIQVLDAWENPTYADGQAGAIYGQHPPLVNPARRPGEWNTYDIIFEAPQFQNGKASKPAYATVFYNGVVVQNHEEIMGAMVYRKVATYSPHAAEEPLGLQDHWHAVRYRNIWYRKLGTRP